MPKIGEEISVEKLMNEGVIFDIDANQDKEEDSGDEGVAEAMLQFCNMDLLKDDDDYNEGEPFDIIMKKMHDLIPSGDIKKRIIREGYGDIPPDSALVKVDYNAYVEYEPTPFDSTYARRHKHEFVLNNGQVIPGLDRAVQSMKISEKSQFLIAPHYAYGKLGCLGRVPQNATVLFEIELHEIVDSGAIITYHKLDEDKQKDFKEIYTYCLALHVRAKEKFKKNLLHQAIKDFNEAIYKLETAQLSDYSDQEKQQSFLLKLYSNILVCSTLTEKPKKGCIAANKIYEIVKDTGNKVEAKVYYNNAKCLRMLGDYSQAKRRLEIAHKLQPRNPDIANEFVALKYCMDEKRKRESAMARAFTLGPIVRN